MNRLPSLLLNYLKRLNKLLLLLCAGAAGFSVVLLYTLVQNNVSQYVTERHYIMQAALSGAGVVVALIIAAINYRWLAKFWFIYMPLTLIAVLLVFTPMGLTPEGSNDAGWLDLGFTTLQPSEFLKIAFILTFSLHLSKVGTPNINYIPNLIPLLIHGALPVLLIAATGDDGTALVFGFIFIFMLFAAGLWWRYILLGAALVPVGAYLAWNYVMQPFQKMRFLVLFDPQIQQEQIQNLYYQQYHSLIALGSGGLTGQGLEGGSYVYVSAIQTDFIFAYIGMTLGFIGAALTVALMLAICFRILHAAMRAKDQLGKLICVGIFAMFLFHSVINIGMALVVLPVLGVPLPFISAGGSSLLATFAAVGLVLSVDGHRDTKYHMFYKEQ
jgi:rod shape determining protein RodA